MQQTAWLLVQIQTSSTTKPRVKHKKAQGCFIVMCMIKTPWSLMHNQTPGEFKAAAHAEDKLQDLSSRNESVYNCV